MYVRVYMCVCACVINISIASLARGRLVLGGDVKGGPSEAQADGWSMSTGGGEALLRRQGVASGGLVGGYDLVAVEGATVSVVTGQHPTGRHRGI
ncbi:hypothetical protein B0T26DRAFT_345755 [Lasiosphaeria miniovina]|uniref:Uncharacterized protein n=1 Tax=Lasiosphaeria miniovina TaxID=1954250 RepID=A0AA40ABJ9_9PEZI|nr:uncharacterized protein B0T26DRAFT_345755 [Lasiosphaeria miniovina]KAK0712826.1 hypothetical protein B0T26DRAFT_345755 [Lasiosphaeria miniovina]